MRATVAIAAAIALLSACALEADFDGTRFSCDQSSDCPADHACVAGECVAGDDPGDVDPASCQQASAVRDDFDSGEIESDWIPFATEGAEGGQDGDAFFILTGEVPGAAGFMSRCSYDLRGDNIYVQVEDFAGGDAETYFEVVTTNENYAALVQHGNVLAARTNGANGNSTRVESSTFDDSQQWWRIEGATDVVHFYTASSEGDWNLVTTHDIPDGFEDAHISFGLRNEDDEDTGPLEARFDNYNGG